MLEKTERFPACIWMDAGIVAYKLCDRNFQCEKCPFDRAMRQPFDVSGGAAAAGDVRGKSPPGTAARSQEEVVHELLQSFFLPLETSTFPEDRMYHGGHTWIKEENTSEFLVGIDHIGSAMLSETRTFILPSPRSRVIYEAPFAWAVYHEGTVSIPAPMHGEVIEVNSNLLHHNEIILHDPYSDGWIARIRGSSSSVQFRSAFNHAESTRSELDQLRREFLLQLQQGKSPTLYDGGVQVKTLQQLLGLKAYLRIVRMVFTPS